MQCFKIEYIIERWASICHPSRIPLKIAGCSTTDGMIGCWILDSSDPDVMYANILITTLISWKSLTLRFCGNMFVFIYTVYTGR